MKNIKLGFQLSVGAYVGWHIMKGLDAGLARALKETKVTMESKENKNA